MLTLKIKIKSIDKPELLDNYISNYTHAYYKLYNNFELSEDELFMKSIRGDFSLYTITCLKINVKTKIDQYQTQKLKKQELLKNLELELQNFKKINKYDSCKKFKLIQKISFLKKSIGKNVCFGGKELLREITKLKQVIQSNFLNESELKEKQILLERKQNDFKEKRQIPIFIIGQERENANKHFRFNFENNKIVYCFNRNNHINIKFHKHKNYTKTLIKLQELSDERKIPITVRLSNDYVYLTFDETKLNEVAFDKNNLKRKQKNCITKEQKKVVYKILIKEHEAKLLKDKIEKRVGAIDLNPNHIGFNITDYNTNKLIYSVNYDLTTLNDKTGKSSTDNKKQIFKRKQEICLIYKDIFSKCKHYKVSKFGIEDLEFKDKSVNTASKEANRQTKNIWSRELQLNQIKKCCNITGIKLIEVNPMYSSFMGNMIYKDYDPIASSRIIAERAQNKYVKGFNVLGNLDRINQEKLDYLLGENICKSSDITSLKELYIKIGKLNYRNKTISHQTTFQSHKSKVALVI